MTFTSAELIAWTSQYLWAFCRIAALVGIAPIFGTHSVPRRIRLGLAIILTLVIVPVTPEIPPIDPFSLPGLAIAAQQIAIGLAMGFAITLVFNALITGGQIIAQLMGLGFASMMDPQNGVAVPMLAQFYTIMATLMYLMLNGHLVTIEVLAYSFQTLPIDPGAWAVGHYWELVAWAGWIFSGAVMIALPAIAALLLVNIAFGVMTRAAPQLNIFAVGFPVTLLIGFVVVLVTLPYFAPKFFMLLEEVFGLLRRLIGDGA